MYLNSLITILGVIFSCISGIWTYTTYTREARMEESKAIVQMSETLVGMQMNCESDWLVLNKLTWNDTDPQKIQKERCFKSYYRSREMVLSASTLIQKPWCESTAIWETAWLEFKSLLERAGTDRYQQESIGRKWRRILELKGIFIVDPTFSQNTK